MTEIIQKALEKTSSIPEGGEKTNYLLMVNVLNSWNQNLALLNTSTTALIGDMNLYIETLERYSTELDNTFGKIIEMAKEEAKKKEEEERRQLEEPQKKQPT